MGYWSDILGTFSRTFHVGKAAPRVELNADTPSLTLRDGGGGAPVLINGGGVQVNRLGTGTGAIVLGATEGEGPVGDNYITSFSAVTPPTAAVDRCHLFVSDSTGATRLHVRSPSGADATIGNGSISATSISATTVTGETLVSTVANGTAPIAVTSTTACTNLNADMLDGKHVSELPYPPAFRHSLTFQAAADSANDVIVYPGKCRNHNDTDNMILATAITKRLDAAWAVGDGSGGLDTGTRASNTWYWLHLIKRSDTGVVDLLFSASPTAPTMPTNYDIRRLIGAVKSNSSNANLVADSRIQGGVLYVEYRDPTGPGLDVSDTALGSTNTTYTLPSIPPTGDTLYQTIFFDCNIVLDHGSAQARLILRNADVIDNASSLTASPLSTLRMYSGGVEALCRMRLSANRNAQIGARSSDSSTTFRLQVLGYEWPVNLGG